MIEQYPHPKKEKIKPSEGEIEEFARDAAINWLIRYVVREGKPSVRLLSDVVHWDEASQKKWEKMLIEIAREEAEKIANDESEPKEVRDRARDFLEKHSQKKENEKEEK
jgi:hypothetical protein